MIQKRILLIEDDANLARMIRILLKDRGYDVDHVSTGEEAYRKIQMMPDMILLDRILPDMDGLEICRFVREDKRTRGIPLIILSARRQTEDRIQGLYVGADDYISKPFEREELIARLDAVSRRLDFAGHLQEERALYLNELERVIREEQIAPFFQPIRSLSDHRPLGVEVFGRAKSDAPLRNPEFLFKLALSCGRYIELEMLCWKKAFEIWRQTGSRGLIFLNCSPYLIESGLFTKKIFLEQGVQPSDVVLELTERFAIQDYQTLFEKLHAFREMGMKIAVDDVGCGFASLNTVAEVKPDFLKIDLSLTRSVDKDEMKKDIIRAIVMIAQNGSITTIAEGIEKEEEARTLAGMGVDAGQGFLLGPPGLSCRIEDPLDPPLSETP